MLSFRWPLRLFFAVNPNAQSLSHRSLSCRPDRFDPSGRTHSPSSGASTDVLTLIQRFGRTLSLNVHLHMLFLDGVYTQEQDGPRFRPASTPNRKTVEYVLNRLVQRIVRRLLLTELCR